MPEVNWTVDAIRDLGATTTLVIAGEILGMGRTKSHELARLGRFPVPVLRHGSRYVVPVAPLLRLLGVDPTPTVRDEPSDSVNTADGSKRHLPGVGAHAEGALGW